MTQPDGEGLRALIAVAVREAVADMVSSSVQKALTDLPADASANGRPHRSASNGSLSASLAPSPMASTPSMPSVTQARPDSVDGRRVETVRICSDADLDAFARRLLTLFENPKNRQDLRAGRYRFTLAPGAAQAAPTARVRRVERGAVTERCIVAAAEAGEQLRLANGAVLTPLAREKARSLGVHVERER